MFLVLILVATDTVVVSNTAIASLFAVVTIVVVVVAAVVAVPLVMILSISIRTLPTLTTTPFQRMLQNAAGCWAVWVVKKPLVGWLWLRRVVRLANFRSSGFGNRLLLLQATCPSRSRTCLDTALPPYSCKQRKLIQSKAGSIQDA